MTTSEELDKYAAYASELKTQLESSRSLTEAFTKWGDDAFKAAHKEEQAVLQRVLALNIPKIITDWDEQGNNPDIASDTTRELIAKKVFYARKTYIAYGSTLERLRSEAEEVVKEFPSMLKKTLSGEDESEEIKALKSWSDSLLKTFPEEMRTIEECRNRVFDMALARDKMTYAALLVGQCFISQVKQVYSIISFHSFIIQLFSEESYDPKPMIKAIASLLMTSASIIARLVAGFSTNPEAVIIANGVDSTVNVLNDLNSIKEAYQATQQLYEQGNRKRQKAKAIAVGDKVIKEIEDDINKYTLAYILFDHLANGRYDEFNQLAQALNSDE